MRAAGPRRAHRDRCHAAPDCAVIEAAGRAGGRAGTDHGAVAAAAPVRRVGAVARVEVNAHAVSFAVPAGDRAGIAP
jgi:hypothetical protein